MKILTLLHFRVCCLLVNLVICLAMMVTVPLCLVGWCWSVGWGVSLVNIASEYLSSVSASEHLAIRQTASIRDKAETERGAEAA